MIYHYTTDIIIEAKNVKEAEEIANRQIIRMTKKEKNIKTKGVLKYLSGIKQKSINI
jgi:hypothetical protein